MKKITLELKNPVFAEFLADNPDFSIFDHDFFALPGQATELNNAEAHAETLELLKAYQRVGRLFPHGNAFVALNGHDPETITERLIASGMDSAHRIADLAEHQFVREHSADCGEDEELARAIHKRAVQVRAQIRHLTAELHGTLGSPHYRATMAANIDPKLAEYVEAIPSYQALFGGLDYIGVEHCASIFGPAAYFLDIMRITDRYLTDPNDQNIPDGYKLRERRPDLFTVPLTCESTNSPIPTVTVVNDILAAKLRHDLGGEPAKRLATAHYPFNLPHNQPLEEIETTLARMDSSLETVAKAYLAVAPEALGYDSLALAQASLGLSPEQVLALTTPRSGPAGISSQYGLPKDTHWGPAPGPGKVSVKADTLHVTGTGTDFTTLQIGQQIGIGSENRTITNIVDAQSLIVDVKWPDAVTDSGYRVYPVSDDLTRLSEFRYRAGEVSFETINNLFTQNLSPDEIANSVGDSFFINATGEGLKPLKINQSGRGDTANPVVRIDHLSDMRLDRLSRFMRLAGSLDLSAAELDWLMHTLGTTEITTDFLTYLAGMIQASRKTSLNLTDLAGFTGLLKTSGKVSDLAPKDPFDLIFNPASLLGTASPYAKGNPIAFDPNRPLTWPVGGLSLPATTGTLAGASASTVVLPNAASNKDDAYVGLAIAITKGPGQGEVGVISSYDGATRTANLYAKWKTEPTASSEYAITMVEDLEDRLAAALQVKKDDLLALGRYVLGLKPDENGLMALTLEALTHLWRLAKLARISKLSPEEYLTLRPLLGLKPDFTPDASDALSELQSVLEAVSMLKVLRMSPPEMAYLLTGVRSRSVNPAYQPQNLPNFLDNLVSGAVQARLTATTLGEAGFDINEADRIVKDLQSAGLINKSGIVLTDAAAFEAASAIAPIKTADLIASPLIDANQAKAALAELAAMQPALLSKHGSNEYRLTPAYIAGQPLEFLFGQDKNAQPMRGFVGEVLDAARDAIERTLYAPIFPLVAASSFVSPDIGVAQSKAIFETLSKEPVPLILPGKKAGTGYLSAHYSYTSSLGNIFRSPARGQAADITAYDGQARVATLKPDLTKAANAFSYYRVVKPGETGTAQAGSKTTITLAASASDKNGAYVGQSVDITAGTAQGEAGVVAAYDGKTRVATLAQPLKTAPDKTSKYALGEIETEGNARGGNKTSIELALSASDDNDAYKGRRLLLVDDPVADAKIQEVRAVMNAQRALIVSLQEAVAAVGKSQLDYTAQSIATFLSLTPDSVRAYLPYACGEYRLQPLLPVLLSPQPATGPTPQIEAMFEGFSQTALLVGKVDLPETVYAAIARNPKVYSIAKVDTLAFADVARIAGVHTFVRAIGDDGNGFAEYLDLRIGMISAQGRELALQALTGWPVAQIKSVAKDLSAHLDHWPGLARAAGVERMQPAFACLTNLAADAAYLNQIAELAQAPALEPTQGLVDANVWGQYQSAASGTMALTNARFHDAEFVEVSDKISRNTQAALRNAMLGFTIWHIGQTQPKIRTTEDLFTFLLIDVETGGCDTTSLISQGINSVQLYMQRCRLGLEPGVLTDQIQEEWWGWMSAYRLWELNRKIFLYPENFIDPFMRRSATPQFEELLNNLLQSQPTDESVAKAFVKYFDTFESLAGLVSVGGYKFNQRELEGDQVDEDSILVGRTNTTPYTYYTRQFTRSRVPDQKSGGVREIYSWGPWEDLDLTIESPYATPVVAFDRPFLFWNEIKPTKSSTVNTTGKTELEVSSDTQSVWHLLLKYSFRTSTGEWLPPQEMEQYQIADVKPNTYKPLVNSGDLTEAYTQVQRYWKQPYAQQIRRGLLASGTLSFAKGESTATGTRTRLGRQVHKGDHIWCNGQQRIVRSVDDAAQTLTVNQPWILAASNAQFNVIPRDRNTTSFPAFEGPGRASIIAGTKNVIAFNSAFDIDFAVGDSIQIEGETRVITLIDDDFNLVVDRKWNKSNIGKLTGTVSIAPKITTVVGAGTKFLNDLSVGDTIVIKDMLGIVAFIDDDETLAVEHAFPITDPVDNAGYSKLIRGDYIGIPGVDGGEKLVVLSGPNINLAASPPAPEPRNDVVENNDGDDPYLSSLNQFNLSLNDSLTLAGVVQRDLSETQGDITGQQTMLLDKNLDQRQVRLFGSTFGSVPGSSPLIRVALDRANTMVFVSHADRPLVGLYWGNAAPGTTQNQLQYETPDRSLMYHLDADNSGLTGFGNQLGWFLASDRNQSFLISQHDPHSDMVADATFLDPIWQPGHNSDLQISFGPYTLSETAFEDMSFRVTRLTTAVAPELKQRLLVGLGQLLDLGSQCLPEIPFDKYYEIPKGEPPAALDTNHLPPDIMDFDGPYGLYFWEIFFHACLAVAEQLKANQNYEKAKAWYEYIFNPMAPPLGTERNPNDRVWQFRPFRDHMDIPSLTDVLNNQFEVNIYNSDPFDPDAIARLRISAYAKATLLKYVDTLIKWADALFTQDTRESITQATNLYVLAESLLGQKPEMVGKFSPPKPMNFDEIDKEYHGNIPQFLIDAENSTFAPPIAHGARFADAPYNDIQAYFGVPDNAELAQHWETIEDRLFKIRNCMNIQGQVRTLALFAPPIDPHAFLQSFGASGSTTGGAGYGAYPLSNYRFNYLIGVAKGMADNVQRLGAGLLSALEKKDAEALSQLRVTQEAQILDLSLQVRQDEITQLTQSAQALAQSRAGAKAREDHYTALLNNGFLPTEEAQIAMVVAAGVTGTIAGVLNTAAAIGYAVPQVGSPFAMTYGGQQLGAVIQAGAAGAEALSTMLRTTGEVLGIYANNTRRREDWQLQQDLAKIDGDQFDAQIAANETQQKIAQRNLELETTRIAQNKEIDKYWSEKFTNEELYQWMVSRLATAHFQAYSLALDFALKAQRAYQFEYRTDASYIAPTYWSDLHKGLTAGESLSNALNALEGAYVGGGSRSYEITKNISLRQLDPRAFLDFVQTGSTHFDLTEALFDRDFPGQYKRRIKSVKITIPALVGPYQNIQATLRQTSNRVVLKPDIEAVKLLQGEEAMVSEGVIESNARPNQSIAISKGQGDTGMFELDLGAPLYLPFEQTGAVSSWELSMPPGSNPVDFNSISDVVMEVLYTAVDGGDGFRREVSDLPQIRQRSWSSLVQPAKQLPADWYALMNGPVSGTSQELTLNLPGLAEPNVEGAGVTSFYLRLVTPEGVSTRSANDYVTITIGNAQPIAVSLNPDGSVYLGLDRAVELPASAPLPIKISFNLAKGYTPAALMDGNRLSSEALLDIDIALFMNGAV